MSISAFKITRNKDGTVCVCSKKPADKLALLLAVERLEKKRLKLKHPHLVVPRKPKVDVRLPDRGGDYYLDAQGRRVTRPGDESFAGKEEKKQREERQTEREAKAPE